MSISNEQIFDLLQEVRQQNIVISADIREIKQVLREYQARIEELEGKVRELEGDNSVLRERVEHLEGAGKRNQIILFGFEERVEDSLERRVLDLFSEVLLMNISPLELDNVHRIGSRKEDRSRPVIIRFVRFSVKRQVLQNISKLRGTGIAIANDLTLNQQQDHKLIYKYYKIAKSKNFEVKIVKNQLIVNNNKFTATDLREASGEAFTDFFINKKQLYPNSSAPATPTRERRSISQDHQSPQKDTEVSKSKLDEATDPKPAEERRGEKNRRQDSKDQGSSAPIITRQTRQARTNSTSSSGKPAERANRRIVV